MKAGEGSEGCGRWPGSINKEPGLQPQGRDASEGLKQGRGLIQLGDPIKGHSGHHVAKQSLRRQVLSLPGVRCRWQVGGQVGELADRPGLHRHGRVISTPSPVTPKFAPSFPSVTLRNRAVR